MFVRSHDSLSGIGAAGTEFRPSKAFAP